MRSWRALGVLCLLEAGGALGAEPAKLNVYISVDMEGVVGTVTSDQLGPAGFEYARYRELMTREALAAVQAAKEAASALTPNGTSFVPIDSAGS